MATALINNTPIEFDAAQQLNCIQAAQSRDRLGCPFGRQLDATALRKPRLHDKGSTGLQRKRPDRLPAVGDQP